MPLSDDIAICHILFTLLNLSHLYAHVRGRIINIKDLRLNIYFCCELFSLICQEKNQDFSHELNHYTRASFIASFLQNCLLGVCMGRHPGRKDISG